MSNIFEMMVYAIFIILASAAFSLVLTALFPGLVSECRKQLEDSRKRMFWLGVVNTLFAAILTYLFTTLGEQSGISLLFFPAVITITFFVTGSLFGLVASFQLIGDHLFAEQGEIKKISYGVTISLIAALTPIVGWFLLAPYLILISFGAFITVIFQRRKKT